MNCWFFLFVLLVVVYDLNVYLFYDEFLLYLERYYKYIEFKDYKLIYRDGKFYLRLKE